MDFTRRVAGAGGQTSHLLGYHSETATMFPGPGCFYGGIQCQQIGLFGDFLDNLCSGGYLLSLLRQFPDGIADAMDGTLKGLNRLPSAANNRATLIGKFLGTVCSLCG